LFFVETLNISVFCPLNRAVRCAGYRRIRKTHGPLDGAERVYGRENQEFAGQVLFATRTGNG